MQMERNLRQLHDTSGNSTVASLVVNVVDVELYLPLCTCMHKILSIGYSSCTLLHVCLHGVGLLSQCEDTQALRHYEYRCVHRYVATSVGFSFLVDKVSNGK